MPVLVIKNRKREGVRIKNEGVWTVAGEDMEDFGEHEIPDGSKKEAFLRIINSLDWRVENLKRITLKAEVPREIWIVLKGICMDDEFDRTWEMVKELDFGPLVSGLFSYYLGDLLEKS